MDPAKGEGPKDMQPPQFADDLCEFRRSLRINTLLPMDCDFHTRAWASGRTIKFCAVNGLYEGWKAQ